MNEQGQVVGVAACKLAGRAVSNIAFAVPINYAKRLLGEQDLQFATPKGDAKQDGPALVKLVSPAVAFVRVSGRPRSEVFTLSVSGSASGREDPLRGFSFGLGPRLLQNFGHSGREVELKIDEYGNRLEITGEQHLPSLFVGSPLVFLEPLPRDGRTRWETQRELTIVEKAEKREDPFVNRFLPPSPFRPRQEETPGKTYRAVEKVSYSLVKAEGDLVSIDKQFELKTQDDPPTLHSTGSGRIEFDAKAGVPKSMTYTGTLAFTVKNVTVRVPLKMTYRLYGSSAPIQRAVPNLPIPLEQNGVPAAPPKPALKEITDDELTQALTDLQDAARRPAALSRLAEAKIIDSRKAEVGKAISPLLAEDASQALAVAVLGTWGANADQVPALVKLLSHRDPAVRRASIALLGGLKDPSTADALAERLIQLSDRAAASDALRSMGPAAEKAVLKLLNHSDVFTRRTACMILAEIGTRESALALAEHAQGTNLGMKLAADAAIKQIEARQRP